MADTTICSFKQPSDDIFPEAAGEIFPDERTTLTIVENLNVFPYY